MSDKIIVSVNCLLPMSETDAQQFKNYLEYFESGVDADYPSADEQGVPASEFLQTGCEFKVTEAGLIIRNKMMNQLDMASADIDNLSEAIDNAVRELQYRQPVGVQYVQNNMDDRFNRVTGGAFCVRFPEEMQWVDTGIWLQQQYDTGTGRYLREEKQFEALTDF